MARLLPLCLLAALAACSTQDLAGNEPFVSLASPPDPWAANSEPQPANSVPPGAGGIPRRGPTTTWPDFGSINLF